MGGHASDNPIPGNDLSNEELLRLTQLKDQGSIEARETLILSYLHLVRAQARKNSGRGVPYDDLFQEGCYGLICAIDRYEYREETTLNAFVWHHINKYIQKAIKNQAENSPITLSEDYYYTLRRYRQVYSDLTKKFGRSPGIQELSEAMDVSPAFIKRLNCVFFHFVSLDSTCPRPNGETERLYSDLISSTPDTPRPTERAALSLLGHQEDILYNTLTDLERFVIFQRIGLTDSGSPEPYHVIASSCGISVETARRAFVRGIKKLRGVLDIDPIHPPKT